MNDIRAHAWLIGWAITLVVFEVLARAAGF